MQTAIHWIDVLILLAYLVALVGVGFYFSRRQSSLSDFFLANRSMAWLPVGLSLMAALNSGIDYLMQPSATIRYGLILLVGIVSWLALYPWVAWVTLPFYRRMNLFTAYEYLEARFDVRVRSLAAGIFILWRLGWMATALYVPSLAINAATSGAFELTPMIIVLGALVTLYTMLGGIRAVIWNDVMQFCVMFGGLAATIGIVLARVPGGPQEVWRVAQEAGKTSLAAAAPAPVMDAATVGLTFFEQPVTIVSILAAMIVGRMASYTADQVMVQRFQTTRSLRDSQRAFVVNAAGDAIWVMGLSVVGLALFAYFQQHPLPDGYESDRILPYFMSREFPAGAVGLVIAAILAASLSSIDSAISACTSVAVVDFYQRLVVDRRSGRARGPAPTADSPLPSFVGAAPRGGTPRPAPDKEDERTLVRVSRAATLVIGSIGTVLACNVSRIGNLLEIVNKLINSFTGPLLGIFVLAMFSVRAGSTGVLAAGTAGALLSYYVAYHSTIGFMWPSTFGLAATLLVGYSLALATPEAARDHRARLTWSVVMAAGDGADVALPD